MQKNLRSFKQGFKGFPGALKNNACPPVRAGEPIGHIRAAQVVGERLFFESHIDLFEAISASTLQNALLLFVDWARAGAVAMGGQWPVARTQQQAGWQQRCQAGRGPFWTATFAAKCGHVIVLCQVCTALH